MAYHRRWMRVRGLLNRPWLILGAAPDPTLSANLPDDVAYVYVKLSGRSAARRNMPGADLTFLPQKIDHAKLEGLSTGHILRMSRHLTLATAARRLLQDVSIDECHLTNGERDRYILHTVGSLFGADGSEARPSNGIALVCFAIALGVPKIIMSGISLESNGHDYNREARRRKHVPQDLAALKVVSARFPQVVTTEDNLHRLAGVPVFEDTAAAWAAAKGDLPA